MTTSLAISGAAAGTAGSPYLKVLSYLAKAIGNYVISEANFAGIGVFIPSWVTIVSGTPANVTVSLSTDNGTTWKVGPTGGGTFFVDSGTTVRINIATGATDIFLFPLGA